MISTQNLTANDLINVAKSMTNRNNFKTKTVAVLVTTTEYKQGEGEKIVSQAIVPCEEVKL